MPTTQTQACGDSASVRYSTVSTTWYALLSVLCGAGRLYNLFVFFFFFFKQKTAYEISTRDWSSDVCSSDQWQKQDGSQLPPSDLQKLSARPDQQARKQQNQHPGGVHIKSHQAQQESKHLRKQGRLVAGHFTVQRVTENNQHG